MTEMLYAIPNIPHEAVTPGKDDSDNTEIRKWGEPTAFDYAPKAHWDIGTDLNILDFDTGAKVTGARFTFYRGLGARLERAIINFYLDTHTTVSGYTEIFPPFMANTASMKGTGQLPKFAEDMYHVEGTDYYLIPTAEVPVTNMTATFCPSSTARIRPASAAKPAAQGATPAASSASTSLTRWSW